MAGRFFVARQENIVTGIATKTLLQVAAAANHAVVPREFEISFDGISNTETPVLVEILRQTTSGTMSSLTLKNLDDSIADGLDATAQHTATVEPTAGDVVWNQRIHPQNGIRVPINDITIPGDGKLGVRVTAAQSHEATVELVCEE